MSNDFLLDISGARRGAILLMALDEDSAVDVFKHFSGPEVQLLTQEMSNLSKLTQEEMRHILQEFKQEAEEFSDINLHSDEHLHGMLSKALGKERASSLLEDANEHRQKNTGIDALNLMEASVIAELIRDEHPQIIATILIHLERAQASDVLGHFNDRLRNEVVLRIATFTGVQPAALQELTEVLGGMLNGQTLKRSKMGGIKTAAEILNRMSTHQESAVIETIRAHNENLAQKIIDEMFLFENLQDLDDHSIQLLLKEINADNLMVALKGASEGLLLKFMSNMSQRAAKLMREEMDARGPIRRSLVDSEQKAILQVVRRLADSGEIVLGGGNDSYV
ncbi:flagellar motor switch protein FliG [Oceanisphaera arctica]|uniref:Flagellar motor switch protein FliG n=1 Tax=Oceanisphaera arctica TaxID=641510 RepID=A0A2P5TMN6_9GAMM|nr:flagellar motor switch protein FliG [Oceanisphaera arctica]PPL16746.1 flagellar motor switch protein FliG [Oceanisphaera arctica]GHA06132.1 flagellar motor switch protein FliG [Oceanisphaera arctica]